MLDHAFERFPGQVQAVEFGIFALQPRQDPQRLGVVVEAAIVRHAVVERVLAGMAERRVAQVVRQRQGFGQFLVQAQAAADRAGDVRDFQRMGQARPVMVAFVGDEDLGLVLHPAECRRVNDPVAVALEHRARRTFRLGVQAAAAARRIACIGRMADAENPVGRFGTVHGPEPRAAAGSRQSASG